MATTGNRIWAFTEARRRAGAMNGAYSIYRHRSAADDYIIRTAEAAPPTPEQWSLEATIQPDASQSFGAPRAGNFTLRYDYIATFKSRWPCHGLPDDLHSISFEFASNGDLVDIEAYDDDGKRLDSSTFDGPALVALSHDAQAFGDESD